MRLVWRAMLAALFASGLWVFALALIGALYRPNTDIPPGLEGEHIDVQTLAIRVTQHGTGPDVLLIHGSPGSIEDWTPLFGALADALRVTAYDRPGHGYSADAGDYSLHANAQLAQSLIERMHLHNVIVVGHGFGGAVALALALRRPDEVRAYVVLDTDAYLPAQAPEPWVPLLATPLIGVGSASLLSPFLATHAVGTSIRRMFGAKAPPADFIGLRTRIWSTPKVAHTTAIEARDTARELATQSLRYPQIDQPLVIFAQRSKPLLRASARRLQHQAAHASVELLDDTSHYLQLDKTRQVAHAIRQLAHTQQVPASAPAQ